MVVLEQHVNTSTADGRLIFTFISAFAQLESEINAAQTRDGLAAAEDMGRLGGRRPKLNPVQKAKVHRQYESGASITNIDSIFSVGRTDIYRELKKSSESINT